MSRPAPALALGATIGWAAVAVTLTPLLLPDVPAYRTCVAAAAVVLFAGALAAPRAAFVLAILSVTGAGVSALLFGSVEPAPAGPILASAYLAGFSLKRLYEIDGPPAATPLVTVWRAFAAASAVSALAALVGMRTSYLLLRGVAPPRVVNVLGADAGQASVGVVAVLASLLVAVGLHGAASRHSESAAGRRALDAAIVGAALLAGAVSLIQKLGALPLWRAARWAEWNRAQATFTDPSSAGVAAALLVAPLLARAASGPAAFRFFAALAVPFVLVILSDSGSRAGLIGTLTASTVFVLWGLTRLAAGASKRSAVRRRVVSTIGTLAILVALALAAALSWPNRGAVRSALLARFEAPMKSEPAPFERSRERLLFYQAAWECFRDHPVVGIGFGGFRTEFPNVAANVLLHPVDATDNPPSLYLGTLAESGLAGGLLLLLLLFGVSRGAGRALTLSEIDPERGLGAAGAAAATIGLLVVFLFGSHLVYPEIAALVGLLTARLPLAREGRTGRLLTGVVPVVLAGAVVLLLGGVAARAWETRTAEAAFRRGPTAGVYGFEWEPEGRRFRWTGPAAAFLVPPAPPGTRRGSDGDFLALPVRNARPDGRAVAVDVFWNDARRGRVVVAAAGWKRLLLSVGRAERPGVLRLEVVEPFRPPGRGDDRLLGIEVGDGP